MIKTLRMLAIEFKRIRVIEAMESLIEILKRTDHGKFKDEIERLQKEIERQEKLLQKI